VAHKDRLYIALASTAVALGAALGFVPPALGMTNCSVTQADLAMDAEEHRMLELVNGYRTSKGLGRLSLHVGATRAAAWFSRDMATKSYFPGDHVDSSGRGIGNRLTQCDAGWTAYAENLAAGNAGAEATFQQWVDSPGHNANMLDGNVTHAGIGRALGQASAYGWYWTLDVIRPKAAGASSEAPSSDVGAAPTTTSAPASGNVSATATSTTSTTALASSTTPTTTTPTTTTPTTTTPTTTTPTSSTPTTDTPTTPPSTLSASAVTPTVPPAGICAALQAVRAQSDERVGAVVQALGGIVGLAELDALATGFQEMRAALNGHIDAVGAQVGCGAPALGDVDLLTAATAS
jgi:uncharacterized protein YkwD